MSQEGGRGGRARKEVAVEVFREEVTGAELRRRSPAGRGRRSHGRRRRGMRGSAAKQCRDVGEVTNRRAHVYWG